MTVKFHEQLDAVFDRLIHTYGDTDELNMYKQELLQTYENEGAHRCANLLKLIKPKQFQIDENGYIRQVN